MKVEELSQYGRILTGLPKEAMMKQKAIVFREIRKKFGLIGILPFSIRLFFEQRTLTVSYTHLTLPTSDLV